MTNAPKKQLTAKQQLFVKEYLVDKNATRAAIAAGYSKATAGAMGNENLKKPEIAAAITEGLKAQQDHAVKRAAKRGVTKERWLRELELIAFADMEDYASITKSGGVSFVSSQDRRPGRGRVIKKITETTTQHGGSTSLELHPKLPALDLLGKHYGWVKERHEHSGVDGGPQVIVMLPSNGREVPNPEIKTEDEHSEKT